MYEKASDEDEIDIVINHRQFIAADDTHRRGVLFNSRAIRVKADAKWKNSLVDKKKNRWAEIFVK